jgi:hypothetical protein
MVLAEQRDQSSNEDAKDYTAAVSMKRANTSIGLGQVVVSTAMRNDLFADLLPASVRSGLEHKQVAKYLTSDEFNLFCGCALRAQGSQRRIKTRARVAAKHAGGIPRPEHACLRSKFHHLASGQHQRARIRIHVQGMG